MSLGIWHNFLFIWKFNMVSC